MPRKFYCLLPALLLVALLAGPAHAARVVAETAPGFEPPRPAKVALIPPMAIPIPEGTGWISCPIAGEAFVPCVVGDAAEAELSSALAAALATVPGMEPTPQAEINAALARLKAKHPEGFGLDGKWQTELAREAGADYALAGFIYCWRDKSGGSYASESPASIAFCLHLIEVSSGRIMWRMRYEDEQKPLFEDLLSIGTFIRRGGKWISSAEMAREAAAEMKRKLPWSKP